MCTIYLAPLISGSSDFPQAGELFYSRIKDAFDASENVVVDMENVSSLPSIFLNVSIGKIIEEYGSDMLKKNMTFTKITKSQALRLKEYLQKFH